MLIFLSPGWVLAQGFGQALRFYGNGVAAPDQDRVKIQIDEVGNSNPGPPADVGLTDFTIEFWMSGDINDNDASAITCGANNNWIIGNIIIDRDRYNQQLAYGISMGAGNLVFGVDGGSGNFTICGAVDVLDNVWHHVAIQRRESDGMMWIYVDGVLDVSGNGPDGDISYPDDGVPGPFCSGPCDNSDPFIVIGAEKHDAGSEFPSYNGFFDEMRISTILRYSTGFTRPSAPFVTDGDTAALYHFDEGTGTTINDTSGATGGPSNGFMNVGGSPSGPEWIASTIPLASPVFAGPPSSLGTTAASTVALPDGPTGLGTTASSTASLSGVTTGLGTTAAPTAAMPGLPTGLGLQ